MAKYVIDDTTLTGIADAIRNKTSGTEPIAVLDMARQIKDIKSGGADEEWIGDGNTRLWVHLTDERKAPLVGVGIKGTVIVDWGDGTEPNVLTGTSTSTGRYTPNHEYAKAGDYVITLIVNGEMRILGGSSSTAPILAAYSADYVNNILYKYALQKIEIGNGVTSIGPRAFYGCHNLTSVTIPEGVTTIDEYTFYRCYNLASINIPEGVTKIGASAFSGCDNLASINIPEGVTSIGWDAFEDCHNLTSLKIPEGVTKIDTHTFSGCYNLTSVTIPEGVTSIGEYAFENCYSLASITIPEGVTSIGAYAFNHCHSLPSLKIPGSVTGIGKYAFYNTYSAEFLDFTDHAAVPSLGSSAFYANKILVPMALVNTWRSATSGQLSASQIVGV